MGTGWFNLPPERRKSKQILPTPLGRLFWGFVCTTALKNRATFWKKSPLPLGKKACPLSMVLGQIPPVFMNVVLKTNQTPYFPISIFNFSRQQIVVAANRCHSKSLSQQIDVKEWKPIWDKSGRGESASFFNVSKQETVNNESLEYPLFC